MSFHSAKKSWTPWQPVPVHRALQHFQGAAGFRFQAFLVSASVCISDTDCWFACGESLLHNECISLSWSHPGLCLSCLLPSSSWLTGKSLSPVYLCLPPSPKTNTQSSKSFGGWGGSTGASHSSFSSLKCFPIVSFTNLSPCHLHLGTIRIHIYVLHFSLCRLVLQKNTSHPSSWHFSVHSLKTC